MISFVDIENPGGATYRTRSPGVEAQEAANAELYTTALMMQAEGLAEEASAAYERLLGQRLIAGAVPARTEVELSLQPSLNLRYLALKHLAVLQECGEDSCVATGVSWLPVKLVAWHPHAPCKRGRAARMDSHRLSRHS